jgi:hypothetical protein
MDPRESFRAAFIETAERRRDRVIELLERPDGAELRSAASELHCLSGEASMLDFARIADLSRVAGRAAKTGDQETLRRVMGDLAVAIEAVRAGRNE